MSNKHIEAVYDPALASKPEEFLRPIPISDLEYWVKHANELAAEVARLREALKRDIEYLSQHAIGGGYDR